MARKRAKDIGPFELLEARRAIEGEACALAALRIDDAQLQQLSDLIAEMRDDNLHNEILMSEEADRRFHELIASSTQNSGIIAAVQMLWDARARSPQSHLMDDKGRARGLKPPIDEHAAIVRALKRRDPEAARAAMHEHITRVIERHAQGHRGRGNRARARGGRREAPPLSPPRAARPTRASRRDRAPDQARLAPCGRLA